MKETRAAENWERTSVELAILGSHILYIDDRLAALSLESYRAARFWSVDTNWCIDGKSHFDDYRKSGPLILFRLARENRKYLFSPSWLEFRNQRNRGLNMCAFIDRFPLIRPTVQNILATDFRALFHYGFARPGLQIDHGLNLGGLGLTHLPDRLQIRDDLILRDNPITELPDKLWIGGNLDVRGTAISTIPDSAVISGQTFF